LAKRADTTRMNGNLLATKAYASIRAAISSGEIEDRDRLYANPIAKRLKMSRTPVREALQRLMSEGLAEKRRDGVYVRALSIKDVRSLEQANRALQGMAAELAATEGDERAMAKLETLMGLMEDCARHENHAGWKSVDQEIRRHLLAMSGNDWLTKLVVQLEPLIGRVHDISFRRPGRMQRSTNEHRKIVDAVKSRDGKAAHDAMHVHLRVVEDNFIEIRKTLGRL
jgi:DNA-binding GntR family transcriptional regulator